MIDTYMPSWKGTLAAGASSLQTFMTSTLPQLIQGETQTYKVLVAKGSQYLTGQLPADMFGQIRRTTAEGAQTGQLSARDLGLARGSADLVTQGASLLSTASNIAKGITDMNSSAQGMQTQYVNTAKTLADVSGLSPDLITSLTTNLASIAQQKYNTDVSAATAAANRNAQLTMDAAARKQTMLLESVNVARSAWDQQLSIADSAINMARIDPSRSSLYTNTATTWNRELADFTNKQLLNKMGTGVTTSNLWS
jgi:hypothetical protein